jgi:hypothetical protein
MSNSRYKIDFPSLERLYKNCCYCPDIIEVNKKSPLIFRKSVELCARYFMREGYSDFLHYEASCDDPLDPDDNPIAFLFCTNSSYPPHAIGACCFRLREYYDMPEKFWAMHWAWIHPYARNKGLLFEHIEIFNKRFGYWYPEPPLSKAMSRFIIKHGLIEPKIHFNL